MLVHSQAGLWEGYDLEAEAARERYWSQHPECGHAFGAPCGEE